MNNQICYRMLYESGEVDVETLRKCYIDTYINTEFSEHKDLKQVVIERGLLTAERYNKILTRFLDSPGKELVKIDEKPKSKEVDIETDIRRTNAQMRAGKRIESSIKFQSEFAKKENNPKTL